MTCHFGYTSHHMTFIILHLAFLGWLLAASRRASPLLRFLVLGFPVASMLYHAFMGAVCASASVSAKLHSHWETNARGRLHYIRGLTLQLLAASVALQCIRETAYTSHRFVKALRMVAVTGPVLTGACLLLYGWGMENGMDRLGPQFRLISAISMAASLFFIETAETARSRAVTSYYVIVLLAAIAGMLRVRYHLDADGRVLPHNAGPDDTVVPHWASPLMFKLLDAFVIFYCGAVAHAALHSCLQQSPPSFMYLLKIKTAGTTAVSAWHLWPVLLSVVFFSSMSHIDVSTEVHGHLRELLGLTTSEAMGSLQIYFQISCAWCAVLVLGASCQMMLGPNGQLKRFWCSRNESTGRAGLPLQADTEPPSSGNWQPNKRHRGQSDADRIKTGIRSTDYDVIFAPGFSIGCRADDTSRMELQGDSFIDTLNDTPIPSLPQLEGDSFFDASNTMYVPTDLHRTSNDTCGYYSSDCSQSHAIRSPGEYFSDHSKSNFIESPDETDYCCSEAATTNIRFPEWAFQKNDGGTRNYWKMPDYSPAQAHAYVDSLGVNQCCHNECAGAQSCNYTPQQGTPPQEYCFCEATQHLECSNPVREDSTTIVSWLDETFATDPGEVVCTNCSCTEDAGDPIFSSMSLGRSLSGTAKSTCAWSSMKVYIEHAHARTHAHAVDGHHLAAMELEGLAWLCCTHDEHNGRISTYSSTAVTACSSDMAITACHSDSVYPTNGSTPWVPRCHTAHTCMRPPACASARPLAHAHA